MTGISPRAGKIRFLSDPTDCADTLRDLMRFTTRPKDVLTICELAIQALWSAEVGALRLPPDRLSEINPEMAGAPATCSER